MELGQSLQDDLAAQEAAARTWQPELEVRRIYLLVLAQRPTAHQYISTPAVTGSAG